MKIKTISSYHNDETMLKYITYSFTNSIITPLLQKYNIEFTLGDDYDYLFIFNGTTLNLSNIDKNKIIGFEQECEWTKCGTTANMYKYASIVFTHYNKIPYPNKMPMVFPPLANRLYTDGYTFLNTPEKYTTYFTNIDNLIQNKVSLHKTKKCSMIVSQKHNNVKNSRYGILQKILQSDLDIDIYGRDTIHDKRYCGPITDRYDSLAPYEYTIVLENFIEPNWTTEKFSDALYTKTYAIYLGNQNLKDRYPETVFSLDPQNITESIQNIIHIPYIEKAEIFSAYLQDFIKESNPFYVFLRHLNYI